MLVDEPSTAIAKLAPSPGVVRPWLCLGLSLGCDHLVTRRLPSPLRLALRHGKRRAFDGHGRSVFSVIDIQSTHGAPLILDICGVSAGHGRFDNDAGGLIVHSSPGRVLVERRDKIMKRWISAAKLRALYSAGLTLDEIASANERAEGWRPTRSTVSKKLV